MKINVFILLAVCTLHTDLSQKISGDVIRAEHCVLLRSWSNAVEKYLLELEKKTKSKVAPWVWFKVQLLNKRNSFYSWVWLPLSLVTSMKGQYPWLIALIWLAMPWINGWGRYSKLFESAEWSSSSTKVTMLRSLSVGVKSWHQTYIRLSVLFLEIRMQSYR